MMFFVFILTLLGMYLLFISAEKYRSSKSTDHFKSLAQKILSIVKDIGLFTICVERVYSHQKYGFSIGFVSWWIFATPLTFLLILWLNPLRALKSSSKS